MKPTYFFFSLIAMLFLTRCTKENDILIPGGDSENCIELSGITISDQRTVTPFNRIVVKGIAELILEQGNIVSLSIEGDKNILSKMQSKVENNTLEIDYLNCQQLTQADLEPNFPAPKIKITLPELKALELGGRGIISSTNKLTGDQLILDLKGLTELNLEVDYQYLETSIGGFGKVAFSGFAKEQSMSIKGSGEYLATELESEICKISIGGDGEAQVKVSRQLDVTISAAGEVCYIGDPEITSSISGSGKLEQCN